MRVLVKTPARLHLGLLDLEGGLGRIFGGIGVALDYPNVILEAQSSNELIVCGEEAEIVKSLVQRFLRSYDLNGQVAVDVKQAIPKHVGLGSETQLALAVAAALAKIFGIKATVRELAAAMGRGRVSGVGAAIFEHGGFIVEGGLKTGWPGHLTLESFPQTVFHHDFPQDWCFVIAIPNVRRGLTDEEESSVFRQIPLMSAQEVGRVCHLTLLRLLPSLVEKDIKNFGDALTQIQEIVGKSFVKVQGGTYSSSVAEECIEYMARLGSYGVGQSSWGPTLYGLVQGEERVARLLQKVQSFLDEKVGGQAFIARGNNRGASVKLED